MVVRHLNYFEDLVSDKKEDGSVALGTERLLFIIEDLHSLGERVRSKVVERIKELLKGNQTGEDGMDQTRLEKACLAVDKLFGQIMARAKGIVQMCIDLIASRLLQRVIEGLSSGFRQVPQRVRVLET